ncbi:MAG: iron chelate uptake ABC transporter family permease subunit [Chitinispirillaceae bacterium]|nr:iron chelate uptake ABC transporter family permease subunit [Chitinispirillaceae bacterium]
MKFSKKSVLILVVLSLILTITSIMSIMIGSVFISPVSSVKSFLYIFTAGTHSFGLDQIEKAIIISIRMPRVFMAVIVGGGLSLCGASMQGLFRNSMADPYVLGMSSGAAVGAAFAIVLGLTKIFGIMALSLLAFTGATITIFVVYGLAKAEGRVPPETLILSGIAVSFFLHAMVSFLKLIASNEALRDIVLWLMGSFSSVRWSDFFISFPLIIFGSILLYWFSYELNALQFGEETAMHLGMEVEKVKRIILFSCALVTGVSVATCGIIGFVGLVVPHIVRTFVGGDHRILLPISALLLIIAVLCIICPPERL